MKLAFLCHRIPYPPDKGEKIRAFHELRALAARHQVDLFTLVDDPVDLNGQSELKRLCSSVMAAVIRPVIARAKSTPYLLTRQPLTIPYFRSRALMTQFRHAVATRGYDCLFVYSSAMAQYANGLAIPVVTDLVDVDSSKWSQYADHTSWPMSAVFRREGRTLRKYERQICAMSRCVLVTTDYEEKLLREISPDANIRVVRVGVDDAPLHQSAPKPTIPTVVFVGDMSYFPNRRAVTYFARSVLPLVQMRVPGTRFLVVGRNPAADIKALQKLPGVEVTGTVLDVRPYLADSHVFVATFSLTAGIPTKLLEAMSCGLPVVGTSTSVRGLAASVAETVRIADTPAEIAGITSALLTDQQLAASIGAESRRRVLIAYRWDTCLEALHAAVESTQMREQSSAGSR